MKKIFDFVGKMNVAVYTFIILLIVSAVGAFIPQGLDAGMYEARYPAWLAAVVLACQFDMVYKAWYFIALLAFLSISITTCLVKRLKSIVAPYRVPDRVSVDEVKGWRLLREYDATDAADEAADVLSGFGYKTVVVGNAVVGHRRRWSRFGEFFVHTGVLIIVAGGVVRGFGHEEVVRLFEGYRFRLSDELSPDTVVECVDVEAERDPNTGWITEYRTRLSLSEPGKKEVDEVIEVNDPLQYGRLSFYQVEMNDDGEAALGFVATKLPDGKALEDILSVELSWRLGGEEGSARALPGSVVELGGTGYTLHVLDYLSNFYVTDGGMSNDNPETNPTVVWMLVKGRERAAKGFSFYNDPALDIYQPDDPSLAGGAFEVRLSGVPETVDHESYLAASGSYVPLGDIRAYVYLKPDPADNPDLRMRKLTLEDTATGSSIDVGYGERVAWDLPDGTYVVQFMGEGVAPYSGLTVSRDPGLGIFYAGAILFSLGVIMALYLRHERITVIFEGNKTVVAGRSNKGNDMFSEKFERVAEGFAGKLGLGPKE